MSIRPLSVVWMLTLLVACAPAVRAQAPGNKPKSAADKEKEQEVDPRFTAGALFSDEMIQSTVERYAHDLSVSLSLDGEVSSEVEKALFERWIPFLKQHRNEIAPLIARFYQANIDPDPPEMDEVKKWAKEALKMYDKFISEMDSTDQDLVKHLTPEQIEQYRLETGKMRMGLGMFRGQLVKWERGEFDPSEWGHQQAQRDRKLRHESEQRKEELAKLALESPELTLVTMAAWDQYVAEFIRKYSLDEAQKSSATSMLQESKDRATQYVKKHESEIDALRTKLQSVSAAERPALALEKAELLKPLEDLFAELKKRLDTLPTDAQRTKAVEGIKSAVPKPTGKKN